jgi:hypothetical protein
MLKIHGLDGFMQILAVDMQFVAERWKSIDGDCGE